MVDSLQKVSDILTSPHQRPHKGNTCAERRVFQTDYNTNRDEYHTNAFKPSSPTRIHRINGVILAVQIPVQRQRTIDVTQPSVRACPATDNGVTLKSVLLQTSSPTIEIAGYSVEETCPRRLL